MAKQLTMLPDTGRTIAYAAIVAHLKADPVLQSVRPAIQWQTYIDDGPSPQTPIQNTGLPAIEMTPIPIPATQEAQVLQNSPLGIRLIVTTPGTDVRDALNLWGAIERSLFPGDGSKDLNSSIRSSLLAASNQQGKPLGSLQTINLSQPAVFAGANIPVSSLPSCITADGFIELKMTVPK